VIRVANAPVSYGVFERTVAAVNLPRPDELLDAVRGAGYVGVDLGPPGFLGQGDGLREALRSRGLALAGGWVAMRFSESAGFLDDLAILERTLDALESAADLEPDVQPKPTLADAGPPTRDRGGIGLDGPGWRRLAEGVREAADRCRSRGLEPTFHHHAGSHVEAPQEIERLLDLTDVGLCLDTGHLLLGGGEPVRAIRDWGGRINHVHLKDARLKVLRDLVAEGAGLEALWRRGAFCELGRGDADLDGVLLGLTSRGYSGWLVVEQDRILAPGEVIAEPAAAQARNRAFLKARGL